MNNEFQVPNELAEKFEEKMFKFNIDFFINPEKSTMTHTAYVIENQPRKRIRDFIRKL